MGNLIASYATVSKSILIQALGIQRNFVRFEDTSAIDVGKSGCNKCPYYQRNHCSHGDFCGACSNRVFVQKSSFLKVTYKDKNYKPYKGSYKLEAEGDIVNKEYVNERDKYGKLPSLSLTSLKILLSLFFLCPSENGMIENVNINELATFIGCSRKSIIYNLGSLRYNGYITFSKTINGCKHILICDYDKSFLKSSKGGRGYVYLSKDFLDEFIHIKDVNTFRISMRAYMELDEINYRRRGGSSFSLFHIKKSFTSIINALPRTFRPCMVEKSLKGLSVFNVECKGRDVHFVLDKKFCGRNAYKDTYQKAKQEISLFVKRFYDAVDLHNYFSRSELRPAGYKKVDLSVLFANYGTGCESLKNEFSDILFDSYHDGTFNIFAHYLCVSNECMESLGRIAAYYSPGKVMEALKCIYSKYIQGGEQIENLAALVKTTVTSNNNNYYDGKLIFE